MEVKSNLNTCLPTSPIIPTINPPHSCNYFTALADDDNEDDITENVLATTPQCMIYSDTALSNSRASSHFVVDGTHVMDKQVATNPITITLPDGATLQSMHTCHVNIPWLRKTATRAHIIPDLAHSLLLSTSIFCNAGYTVAFDNKHCTIYDGGIIILQGTCDPATNLWRLPLCPRDPPQPQTATILAACIQWHTHHIMYTPSHTYKTGLHSCTKHYSVLQFRHCYVKLTWVSLTVSHF